MKASVTVCFDPSVDRLKKQRFKKCVYVIYVVQNHV